MESETEANFSIQIKEDEIECPVHPEREAIYVCLDPLCTKPVRCCIMCVRYDHATCKDQFILKYSILNRKVEFENIHKTHVIGYRQDIENIFDEMNDQLMSEFQKYREESIKFINQYSFDKESMNNFENIAAIREKFTVSLKEDNSIKIEPRNYAIEQDMDRMKQSIKSQLQQKITGFAEDLRSFDVFEFGIKMEKRFFEGHESIGRF